LVGSSLPTKVVPTTVRLVLSTGFLLVSSLLLSLYKMFDKPTSSNLFISFTPYGQNLPQNDQNRIPACHPAGKNV